MNREKALETIIVLALALLMASVWFGVHWLIFLSMGFLGVTIVSKRLTVGIAKVWFVFSEYLATVMNYIIMFAIFYAILCPIAFFQRLFKKNQILKASNRDTYFVKRNNLYSKKDLENPW